MIFTEATPVEPLPIQLSKTISPSSVYVLIRYSNKSTGFWVGWNLSLFIAYYNSETSWTQKLTVTGLVNLINNLADLTGFTSQKLTIGATNLAKLSSAQVLVLTSKNWTVA